MPNWISKFKIALASDGVNALRPLSDLVIAEPNQVVYKPFTTIVGKNGIGRNVTMGFPVIAWLWDWLPQTDLALLQGFEAKDVYIQTETDTGVSREFRIFACYAQPFGLGEPQRLVAYDGRKDGLRERRSLRMDFGAPEEQ